MNIAKDNIAPAVSPVDRWRADFPILERTVHDRPLAYLDNAATTQKPRAVIDAVSTYYETTNSNIHRGVHTLSQLATEEYERSRDKIRDFINAGHRREIIFVRGTTEAINLIACCFGQGVKAGDEIVISHMEHHSNIVPWQLLCQRTGAVLRVIPINEAGEIDVEAFDRILGPNTRLVSIVHISNALGTINPIKTLIDKAHRHGVPVLIDGAQAVAHIPVDVQALDCDFYAFSGHKLFAPTGIGVLYGKAGYLEQLPPYQGGGDMIKMVSFEKTVYNDLPYRFEAGTPNIAGTIGLGAAVDYLRSLDRQALQRHEEQLLAYATSRIGELPGVRVIGTARRKAGVLSFVFDDIHPHDVGTILDQHGVATRTGHHCAMPLMEFFKVPATVRASFAFYNTFAEIDRLGQALERVREVFNA